MWAWANSRQQRSEGAWQGHQVLTVSFQDPLPHDSIFQILHLLKILIFLSCQDKRKKKSVGYTIKDSAAKSYVTTTFPTPILNISCPRSVPGGPDTSPWSCSSPHHTVMCVLRDLTPCLIHFLWHTNYPRNLPMSLYYCISHMVPCIGKVFHIYTNLCFMAVKY